MMLFENFIQFTKIKVEKNVFNHSILIALAKIHVLLNYPIFGIRKRSK